MENKKTRKFKDSKVKLDEAARIKIVNDQARAIENDYKQKIEELEEAKTNMFNLSKNHAMQFDMKFGADAIEYLEKFDLLLTHLLTIEKFDISVGILGNIITNDRYVLNAFKEKMIFIAKMNITELKFSELDFLSNISEVPLDAILKKNGIITKFDMDDYITKAQTLYSDTNAIYKKLEPQVTNNAQIIDMANYMKAIDTFLDVYSAILEMDPRNEDEKSKGYRDFVAKILKETISDSTKETIEKTVEEITKTVENFSGKLASGFRAALGYISSQFFGEMPSVDSDALVKNVNQRAIEEADKEKPDNNLDNEAQSPEQETAVSMLNVDLSNAVNLDNQIFLNAVHNNAQAKVNNMIEISKAECIEFAALLQSYVITKCKHSAVIQDQDKCDDYNHRADLLMKNCGIMFPMETSYDEVLNQHIQLAVSEQAIVSDSGSIIYIGAGKVLYEQNNFVPLITAEQVTENINSNSESLLLGTTEVFNSDATGVVLIK